MSFYTPEIHDRIDSVAVPKMPLLKMVFGHYVLSGVIHLMDGQGIVKPVYISNRWLSVRPDQVERVLNGMTSGNTTNVWYEERKFGRVPGVLVELAERNPVAHELRLGYAERTDQWGQSHTNEIVVSHELLGMKWLKSQGVCPQIMGNRNHIDLLSIEEAIEYFNRHGDLPRLTPRVNRELAAKIVG